MGKVVIFLQSGCIQAKWLYSGRVVVSGQKWLYSVKMVVFGKVAVFGQSGCIRTKVVVFGKKWWFSVTRGYIRTKWLCS